MQLYTKPSKPAPVLEKCLGLHAGSLHPFATPLASRFPRPVVKPRTGRPTPAPSVPAPQALQSQLEPINSQNKPVPKSLLTASPPSRHTHSLEPVSLISLVLRGEPLPSASSL